jgi:uncharacterized protein
MLQGYRLYDADAHAMMSPRMWQKTIQDYARSARIFLAGEADDKMLVHEIALLGEDQILYSSDLPHGEGRHNAPKEILARTDLSEAQKQKILYHNAVEFFGEP